MKVLAPKELLACLEQVITMDIGEKEASFNTKEVDDMISMTKQSALLLANQLINYRHWPSNGDSWIDWRKETALSQLMLVGECDASGQMIDTLRTNLLALSVYDSDTAVNGVFGKLLLKCLHAVSCNKIEMLGVEGEDVPKAKLGMG